LTKPSHLVVVAALELSIISHDLHQDAINYIFTVKPTWMRESKYANIYISMATGQLRLMVKLMCYAQKPQNSN